MPASRLMRVPMGNTPEARPQTPTMVVYPEGTWYHGMSADRIPHFVQQHLIEGRPVNEWIFARNPLSEEEGQTDAAE